MTTAGERGIALALLGRPGGFYPWRQLPSGELFSVPWPREFWEVVPKYVLEKGPDGKATPFAVYLIQDVMHHARHKGGATREATEAVNEALRREDLRWLARSWDVMDGWEPATYLDISKQPSVGHFGSASSMEGKSECNLAALAPH